MRGACCTATTILAASFMTAGLACVAPAMAATAGRAAAGVRPGHADPAARQCGRRSGRRPLLRTKLNAGLYDVSCTSSGYCAAAGDYPLTSGSSMPMAATRP
jgi:hypothetical protein